MVKNILKLYLLFTKPTYAHTVYKTVQFVSPVYISPLHYHNQGVEHTKLFKTGEQMMEDVLVKLNPGFL
jgi:hypothetical protein